MVVTRGSQEIYSDESCTGYAGYLVEHGNHVAHGMCRKRVKPPVGSGGQGTESSE